MLAASSPFLERASRPPAISLSHPPFSSPVLLFQYQQCLIFLKVGLLKVEEEGVERHRGKGLGNNFKELQMMLTAGTPEMEKYERKSQ